MQKQHKFLIFLSIIVMILFSFGITYSFFHSSSNLYSNNQEVANFVFNSENLNQFEIPIFDIKPGEVKEYLFKVSNNQEGEKTEVTVEYKMIIKTYHFIPLDIEVYKIVDDTEELVFVCDESYSRNESNELVCNSSVQEMGFDDETTENYKLKISLESSYNNIVYSNLIDYIDMEIKSWQKY